MTKDKSIFIKNIYYMLSYAFTNLRWSEEKQIAAEAFDNIHNLFAAILSRGMSYQLKKGLYREYISCQDDLPLMHGKVNIQGTIKNKIARKQRLTCEFDELSQNNLLNQILKTTAMLLLRCDDVSEDYKKDLKNVLHFFYDIDEVNSATIKWSGIRLHRNNQSYRILISICQLIIEGMLLTTEKGEYKLASFIDDQEMSRLYEKFILEYYKREHPEVNASPAQIRWDLDEDKDTDTTLLPCMASDVTLEDKASDKILIIDAKYYTHTTQTQYDKHTIHSNNLYQIFTYVKNKDAALKNKHHPVSGLLLYAKTDEEIQPDADYKMSGNMISVNTLDLNKEFSEISGQLDDIVTKYFGINNTKP